MKYIGKTWNNNNGMLVHRCSRVSVIWAFLGFGAVIVLRLTVSYFHTAFAVLEGTNHDVKSRPSWPMHVWVCRRRHCNLICAIAAPLYPVSCRAYRRAWRKNLKGQPELVQTLSRFASLGSGQEEGKWSKSKFDVWLFRHRKREQSCRGTFAADCWSSESVPQVMKGWRGSFSQNPWKHLEVGHFNFGGTELPAASSSVWTIWPKNTEWSQTFTSIDKVDARMYPAAHPMMQAMIAPIAKRNHSRITTPKSLTNIHTHSRISKRHRRSSERKIMPHAVQRTGWLADEQLD